MILFSLSLEEELMAKLLFLEFRAEDSIFSESRVARMSLLWFEDLRSKLNWIGLTEPLPFN